jgi:hypothetical protein
MKVKSTIKSAFLTPNHSHSYGAKSKVIRSMAETDFAVNLSCNRKVILDF